MLQCGAFPFEASSDGPAPQSAAAVVPRRRLLLLAAEGTKRTAPRVSLGGDTGCSRLGAGHTLSSEQSCAAPGSRAQLGRWVGSRRPPPRGPWLPSQSPGGGREPRRRRAGGSGGRAGSCAQESQGRPLAARDPESPASTIQDIGGSSVSATFLGTAKLCT